MPPDCRASNFRVSRPSSPRCEVRCAGRDGRLEALHALGDISEQQVEQLMKLRELMMADMSSKQAYQAAVIQQQAASEAATQRFFTYTPSQSGQQGLPCRVELSRRNPAQFE